MLPLAEAMAKAAPYLLDPIMRVEILVPEAFMGEVIGDLNAERGAEAAAALGDRAHFERVDVSDEDDKA